MPTKKGERQKKVPAPVPSINSGHNMNSPIRRYETSSNRGRFKIGDPVILFDSEYLNPYVGRVIDFAGATHVWVEWPELTSQHPVSELINIHPDRSEWAFSGNPTKAGGATKFFRHKHVASGRRKRIGSLIQDPVIANRLKELGYDDEWIHGFSQVLNHFENYERHRRQEQHNAQHATTESHIRTPDTMIAPDTGSADPELDPFAYHGSYLPNPNDVTETADVSHLPEYHDRLRWLTGSEDEIPARTSSRSAAWQDWLPQGMAQKHFRKQQALNGFQNPLRDPQILRALEVRGMNPQSVEALAKTYDAYMAKYLHTQAQKNPLGFTGAPGFGQHVVNQNLRYAPKGTALAPQPMAAPSPTPTVRPQNPSMAAQQNPAVQRVLNPQPLTEEQAANYVNQANATTGQPQAFYGAPKPAPTAALLRKAGRKELNIVAHAIGAKNPRLAAVLQRSTLVSGSMGLLCSSPKTRVAGSDRRAIGAMRRCIAGNLRVADWLKKRGATVLADRVEVATVNAFAFPKEG